MIKAFFYFLSETWKVNKKLPIILFFSRVIMAILGASILILPKFVIDAIFVQENTAQAIFWIAVVLISQLLLTIFKQVLERLEYVESQKTFQAYSLGFAERMMDANFEAIESQKFLDIKARADLYLNGGRGGFLAVLREGFDVIGAIFTGVGLAGVVWTLHPLVVLAIVIIVLINIVFMIKGMAPIQNFYMEQSVVERRSYYFKQKIHDFQYGKEIRNYNLASWFIEKFKAQLDKQFGFYKKIGGANFELGFYSVAASVLQLGVAYFYLFKQSFAGLVTVGSFAMYVATIPAFFEKFLGIVGKILELGQYAVVYQAFKTYIDTPIEQLSNDNKPALPERFEVAFEDVSFKYGSAENFALENVSVKFNNKERIAIIGENGAGKSTFVKLLMRLYKPTSGRILLNGVDINEIDYEYYQTLFATVFQDFKLFSFSIRDNITFGSEQTKESEARLEKILRTTGVAEMVEGLEHGLDTNMYRDFDDAGFTPSGGQGQKIAIARAAYKDSPIVILDEPTAALDPRAENQIYEQFEEFFKDRCSLYISHRMAVTKFSDRTLVFDGGHIVQDGTHSSLIAVDGKYKELYDLQAQYYTEEKTDKEEQNV